MTLAWFVPLLAAATTGSAAAPAATPPPATAAAPELSPPSGTTPAAAPPAVAWQTIAPGAERATLTLGGLTEVMLFRFDLERFRAEVVVGKGMPPRPRTAADLRQGRGAIAAVNGGFFDERAVPLGLRIAGGDQRFPLRPKSDWGVLVLGGHRARIIHTREYPRPSGATTTTTAPAAPMGPTAASPAPLPSPIDGAIQVGPRLLVEGQPVKLRPQIARRTAVAVDREGRMLTLVIADGPVDAAELAAALAGLGFDAAILLDGGPSTQLSVALADTHVDVAGVYPVPDLLAIFTRAPPHRAVAPPPRPTVPR